MNPINSDVPRPKMTISHLPRSTQQPPVARYSQIDLLVFLRIWDPYAISTGAQPVLSRRVTLNVTGNDLIAEIAQAFHPKNAEQQALKFRTIVHYGYAEVSFTSLRHI